MVLAFWLGVLISSAVLIAGTTATTFDADVTAGESQPVRLDQRVDQGALSRLLAPTSLTLGSVRLTKRGWGLVSTYSEEITVAGGRASARAGIPMDLRVTLEMPGTVVATNATGREGRTLMWAALPPGGTLRATTRAVNWPLAALLVAAVALSLRLRRHAPGAG
jgi:hypothetical protein